MATDPVCGMTVDPANALSANRDGQTYYFCSDYCRRTFLAAPAAAPLPRHDAHADHGSMAVAETSTPHGGTRAAGRLHLPDAPAGRAGRAGDMPLCGMALEPKSAQAGDANDTELTDLTRRFRAAILLTGPLLLLAMLPMLGVPMDRWLGGI